MRSLIYSAMLAAGCAAASSAAYADTGPTETLQFTKQAGCDSSQYYCTYQAKVSEPTQLWNYSEELDDSAQQVLADAGLKESKASTGVNMWSSGDMVVVGAEPISGAVSSWPDQLTMKVNFSGVTPPDPGPTPDPTPSAGDMYFTVDLSNLDLGENSNQAKVIVVPKDSTGAPVKDQAGNPIIFNTTADHISGKTFLCANWNDETNHTITMQSSLKGCSQVQWLDGISAQPASVSVSLMDVKSEQDQSTISLYSQSKGALNTTFELQPQGNPTRVNLTADDESSTPSDSNIAFYDLQYTDKSTNVALDFPLSFTLAPQHMLNIAVPETSAGGYKLTEGVSVTGFKDASIDDPVIDAEHTESRKIIFKDHEVPEQVNIKHGWPENRIAMGSATDFTNEALLDQRHNVDSVFKYADNDGAGDRGVDPKTIWTKDGESQTATARTVDLAQRLSATYDHPVVPVLVEYTAQSSGGSDTGTDDLLNDQDLKFHYENLLLMARYLENHPDPSFKQTYGTLVLNPDFLGEVFKDKGYVGIQPHVVSQLKAAIDDLHKSKMITDAEYAQYSQIPQSLTQSSANTLTGFVQSTNWLVKAVAPKVPFGWSLNIWAGDTAGHNWVHNAYNDPSSVARHVDDSQNGQCDMKQTGVNYDCGEVPFLRSVGAYGNANEQFNPTFVAFDKYERDTLLTNGQVYAPYLYNANDWSVYVQYVGEVSHELKDVPVMMFQIPGGHMIGKKNQDKVPLDGATAVDYVFGNTAMAGQSAKDSLDIAAPYQTGLTAVVSNDYHFPEANANYLDYLGAAPKVITSDNYQATKDGYYDWGHNHMNDLRRANVFSILWGGGSTLSMAGPGQNDDGGYLDRLAGEAKTQ